MIENISIQKHYFSLLFFSPILWGVIITWHFTPILNRGLWTFHIKIFNLKPLYNIKLNLAVTQESLDGFLSIKIYSDFISRFIQDGALTKIEISLISKYHLFKSKELKFKLQLQVQHIFCLLCEFFLLTNFFLYAS